LNEAAVGCDCEPLSSMKNPNTTTAVNKALLKVNIVLIVEREASGGTRKKRTGADVD
jgi:hypothetical protein